MPWNGSRIVRDGETADPPPRRPRGQAKVLKGVAAGLVVAVLGCIAVFFIPGREPSKPLAPEPPPKTKVKTVKPPKTAPLIEKKVESVVVPPVETNLPRRLEGGVEVVSSTSRTNQSGAVIERLRLADGRLIEKVHPKKSIFKRSSDQMIALALSVKPGQSMPPLPNLGDIDRDFQASLDEPIEINDDDPEDVKKLKLDVKEARAYIAAEIKNGRTVQQCLNDHRNELERIADRHQLAVQEIQKLKQNGSSPEEIAAFRKRINEFFKDKGIPELPEPTVRNHQGDPKK